MSKKKRVNRDLYLVEQNVDRILDREYLCEAVIAASTKEEALEAAVAMSDDREGLGLVVDSKRLEATRLGPLEAKIARHRVRWSYRNCWVLAYTAGEDI